MGFVLQPWHLLHLILAGWVNRQQQQAIEYLRTETQVLREKLGRKRILLNDDQRRRLAVKGKVLGRKMLRGIATMVTPDTLLRWHQQLIARKWDRKVSHFDAFFSHHIAVSQAQNGRDSVEPRRPAWESPPEAC